MEADAERASAAATEKTAFPPGPRGHPLVGNLPEFGRDLLGFLDDCARRYGDMVGLRLANYPTCFINHPDLVEDVLVTRNAQFRKHRFFWRHVESIFGNGLLTSEGDFWRRQRRLAQPAFHRERIAGYGAVMVAEAEQMLAGWGAEEERDVHEDLMGVTMRIVARTLFGADLAARVEKIGSAFDVVVQEIAVRFRRPFAIPDWVPLPSNLRYRRAVRQLDRLVYGILRQPRRDDADDLVALLLRARDEDGRGMSERQLRDEAVTIFLAGHETTALALSWALALLARHPPAQDALAAELDTVLGGRAPAVADLPRLRYAEAVVLESMRLYPPAYVVGRESTAEVDLGGYRFPAGPTGFASPWVMHRDPRYFERPAEFDPSRWLDGLAKRLPRFAYFPFGGGPRLCIGNSFAMMESTLILAALAQRFRMTPVRGHVLETLASITLRPRFGVRLRLARREPCPRPS
jgi:cytochrome P450